MNPIIISTAGNPENEDRGFFGKDGNRMVLCVADGAGGSAGAIEAATKAIDLVRQSTSFLTDMASCATLLARIDMVIASDPTAGETTCAFAIITPREIFGASVGDSEIWFIPTEEEPLTDLTLCQQRKPLLGSNETYPVPFQCPRKNGWLLLATDGLFKYTSVERILQTCRQNPTEEAAPQLVELVRYRSGTLPDDVTVILTNV